MGRELKRVALDFDWQLNKPWKGYCNEHYKPCAACDGSSSTIDAKWLDVIIQLLLLVGSDGANRSLHPWLRALVLAPSAPPTSRFAELTTGLAGRAPSFFGHDSIDQWRATKKILKAAGLSKDWGQCPTCAGEGIDPTVREAYEAWEKTGPPAGEGWQLWETVSEGSPITPVFPTAEGLADWLANSTAWGANETRYEQWLKFLTGPGWAPSLVMQGGQVMSGVEAVTKEEGE